MPFPLVPIIAGAGAVYSAIKGGQQQGKANDLNEEAIRLAREDWESRRPLREGLTRGALTPIAEAPDLSSTFASGASSNPFWSAPSRSAHVGSQLDFSGISTAPTPQGNPQGKLADKEFVGLPSNLKIPTQEGLTPEQRIMLSSLPSSIKFKLLSQIPKAPGASVSPAASRPPRPIEEIGG